jgi:endo-1,4-beta-xylanase
MPRLALLPLLLLAAPLVAAEPMEIPLWEKGAPGFESRKDEKEVRDVRPNGEYRVTNVHNPTVTVILPSKEKANGAAVVILPGGGHRELWMMHEGINPGKWLADHGIAAFVVKYRLAREKDSPYKIETHSVQDGQRAIRWVRERASELNVDPNRVGIMGFSAGGETAAMVCNAPDGKPADGADAVDRQSAKPNFVGLVYAGPLGIRDAKVTKEYPPTFILVGDNDGAGNWLVNHYLALKKAGVSTELHVYAKTPHGFGVRESKTHRPVDSWLERFAEFLTAEGMLKKG